MWGRHKDVANATMIDFDDVRLLRPVNDGPAFAPGTARPAPGQAGQPPDSRFTATLFPVADWDVDAVVALVEAAPTGGSRVAVLRTEPAVNTFPALPVRDDEFVVVRIFRHDSAAELAAQDPAPWTAVEDLLVAPVTELVLRPTARSALR